MPHIYKVGKMSEINSRTVVTLDNREIVILRQDNQVFALSNVCSHQHIPRLHEGTLECYSIECPMHGWRYDIRTGKSLTGDGNIPVYDLKIENDILSIEIPDEG